MKKTLLFSILLLTLCLIVCPLATADEDLLAGDPEKNVFYIFASGGVQGSFAPQETCVYCHGNGGKGTTFGKQAGVPDFTDKRWQASSTNEQLMETLLAGHGKMPSYRGKLTEATLKKVVQIVRNFAIIPGPRPHPPIDPKE